MIDLVVLVERYYTRYVCLVINANINVDVDVRMTAGGYKFEKGGRDDG